MRGISFTDRMSLPSVHISISSGMIAFYAAVVSTVTASVQLWHFLRDRARIKLHVRRNMEIIGGPGVPRKGLTLVYVANRGRRPVTITAVGGFRLYPNNPFIIPECNPNLPHELTEGKSLIATLPPCDLDFSQISHWEAYDAVGHRYRLSVAGWYLRLRSRAQWRLHLRRDRKKKRLGGKHES